MYFKSFGAGYGDALLGRSALPEPRREKSARDRNRAFRINAGIKWQAGPAGSVENDPVADIGHRALWQLAPTYDQIPRRDF